MIIRYANNNDINNLLKYDEHIKNDKLLESIKNNKILILEDNNEFIGWLRYNLFWDNTPFMNMLYILDKYQKQGYGSKLVNYWECEMKELGYNSVMTSTLINENAKFFYEKLGYKNIGGFTLPNEPLEIIYFKEV